MKKICNWSGVPSVEATEYSVSKTEDWNTFLTSPFIVRGNGRSYGDSSLFNTVVSSLSFQRILHFDQEKKMITCESGILLHDLLKHTLPYSLAPAVLPGTRFITVGGAVAQDVHGKNHPSVGSFSSCVESFRLLTADGLTLQCSREENEKWFWYTLGGCGLTGVILDVTLRLQPFHTHYFDTENTKVDSIKKITDHFLTSDDQLYKIAWIGNSTGSKTEAIFSTSKPSGDLGKALLPSSPALSVPLFVPLVNRVSIKAFNSQRYKNTASHQTEPWEKFFFPLDGIRNWNKAYGKKGFLQYQFAVPKAHAEIMEEILARIQRSKRTPFLTVIKQFGRTAGRSPLSFPIENGFTFCTDLKWDAGLPEFFNELDELVIASGGRVYLAKDARLQAENFRRMYPQAGEFINFVKEHNEGHFISLLSQRLKITN